MSEVRARVDHCAMPWYYSRCAYEVNVGGGMVSSLFYLTYAAARCSV